MNLKSKSRNLEKDAIKVNYYQKIIIATIIKIKFLKLITIIKNQAI